MELAKYIKDNLKYIFVRGDANESTMTYVYTNGYYRLINDDEFKGFIKSFIPYQLRKSRDINEVLFELKTEMNFVNYNDLNNNEDIINFQDGIYNILNDEFYPHSPDILSTIQIPANYADIKNAPAEAPTFFKYAMTLVNDDIETFELLMQCLGVAISNISGFKTKKALFLVGKGNTGKSQIKRLAEYLIGQDNISNVDLKKLNDRFGTASIYQKRLVGCNDMSYQRIEDMSIFKQLTGGDALEIEFKNKASFTFLYKGFLWFNCNKLPRFGGDTGKWVYERIMPIFCNNVIPKEEQDPLLFEKMVKEKNTIINIALMELQKVIKNNYHFIEPKNMEIEREKYGVENNTFLSFIKECCYISDTILPSCRIRRSVFKDAYDKYVQINYNNKGKLNYADVKLILENDFNEFCVKSNGNVYMSKINLTPEARAELDIYDPDYYKINKDI